MIYSRHEIVELVHQQAPELQELLIALMWFASHADPNLISENGSSARYGLTQVDLTQACASGFTGAPETLLDPETNIKLAAQLIHTRGLLEFCGRELAMQLPAILRLEQTLRGIKARDVIDVESARNPVESKGF